MSRSVPSSPLALLFLMVVFALGCAHGGAHRPAGDRDRDGIEDSADKCPNVPEDRDHFEDADGCPDVDNDGDGVPDTLDLCPSDPEDRDGFKDDDGCPEPDNDEDRIVDTKDHCPSLPEVYNGFEDSDGCPDPRAYDADRYGYFTDALFVVRPIFFAERSARLEPSEARYLDRFAAWLNSEPAVERVALIGHVGAGEEGGGDLALSRALAVHKHVGLHVARHRLLSYGAKEPAVEWAKVKRPRRSDRSVHIRFFKVKGVTVYRWNGSIDVPAR